MAVETGRSRVLIAEDDCTVAALFEDWLLDEYDVQTVHSGEAALDAVAETEPDIVLLNRQIPGLSGEEVVHRIAEAGYDVQVLMMTAVKPSPAVATLPVDEYLLKPISPDELSGAVETAAIVATYDDRIGELLGLATHQHTLQEELSTRELENSREFEQLTDQITELRESLDRMVDELRRQSDTDIFVRLDTVLNSRG